MDWIKVEKATLSKPEIMQIASILKIEPLHAFGLCVKFWSWCDDQADKCHILGVTFRGLSAVLGHTNVCEALGQVGWLIERDDGIEIPKFDRHLSQSAKKRANDAERKRLSRLEADRTRTNNGQNADRTRTREDKRREEKSNTNTTPTPSGTVATLPVVLRTVEFETAWKEWQQYRIGIRKKLTAPTIAKQLKMLEGLGVAKAIQSIGKSIEAGWSGLFDPGSSGNGNGTYKPGIAKEVWDSFTDDDEEETTDEKK